MNRRHLISGSLAVTTATVLPNNVVLADAPRDGFFHMSIGGDDWVPTQEDMEELSKLFHAALHDPNGGVLVTRSDVKIHWVGKDGKPTPPESTRFLHVELRGNPTMQEMEETARKYAGF